jgi:polygalacturonase
MIMKKTILYTLLLLLSIGKSFSQATQNPVGNQVTLNYLIGDGKTNQTTRLQKAIDSCGAAGGGTLIIPKGTFLLNPITLKSNVYLYLNTQAVLQFTTDSTLYVKNNVVINHLINGDSLHNVAILGTGTIDGSGSTWWTNFNANGNLKRPKMIVVNRVVNFIVDGVTLKNAPMFHIKFFQCKYVTINNLTITAPSNSPNTDGVDPANSKHVVITKCTIGVGDDNIAIKSGRVFASGEMLIGTPPGGIITEDGITEDIHISNCTFLSGHGLSIGSEIDCGVRNYTVRNCTFTGTSNGIRIKSNVGLGGPLQNLHYSNITMKNVANPLIITFNYTSSTGTYPDTPSLNGFYIDSLTATGAGTAGSLAGLSNSILNDVSLTNVTITGTNGLSISNAKNVTLCNVNITPSAITTSNVQYSTIKTTINTLSATLQSQSVSLDWSLGCVQSLNYGIFRSTDGVHFSKISQVSGTNTTTMQFTDNSLPSASVIYYRIGGLLSSSDTAWSSIASVSKSIVNDLASESEENAMFSFYPNPVKDQLFLSHPPISSESWISIYSMEGRMLQKMPLGLGATQSTMELDELNPGAYLLVWETPQRRQTQKFFKY